MLIDALEYLKEKWLRVLGAFAVGAFAVYLLQGGGSGPYYIAPLGWAVSIPAGIALTIVILWYLHYEDVGWQRLIDKYPFLK